VLASSGVFSVAQLEALGVRRVSVGGGLARAALSGLLRAAEEVAREGTFRAVGEARPHAELNAFFREDARKRRAGARRG